MDRFFHCYDKAVKVFALLALLFMTLYFSVQFFLHGGITGVLDRLMTGESQVPFGDRGELNLQSNNQPPSLSEEQGELIL